MRDFCHGHIHTIAERDIHDYIDIYLDPIIVIITFILGYVISNAISKNQEKRKFSRIFAYFQLYFKAQIKSIRAQINLIIEQKNKVLLLKNTSGLDIIIVNQPYFILDGIKKEELFSAWTSNKKRDPQTLINILKFIEFTRKSFDRYSEHHKSFLERQNGIRERWNERILEFHKLKASLINSTIEKINQDPDILQLNKIYNDWTKTENSQSLEETILQLANPLLRYFEPIYGKNPSNQVAFILISKSQELGILFAEWKNEIESYSKYLAALTEALENEIHKIPNEI